MSKFQGTPLPSASCITKLFHRYDVSLRAALTSGSWSSSLSSHARVPQWAFLHLARPPGGQPPPVPIPRPLHGRSFLHDRAPQRAPAFLFARPPICGPSLPPSRLPSRLPRDPIPAHLGGRRSVWVKNKSCMGDLLQESVPGY